jgi:hypothetical protein
MFQGPTLINNFTYFPIRNYLMCIRPEEHLHRNRNTLEFLILMFRCNIIGIQSVHLVITGSYLVQFPAFYGTPWFITAFTTRAHHLSLSSARPIQSTPPYPTSCRSILMLSSHLTPGLSLRFPQQNLVYISSSPKCTRYSARLILD